MYSIKSPNHEKKAAKGVSGKQYEKKNLFYFLYLGHVRNNLISHEDYKNCLFMEIQKTHPQVRIGHNAHQLNTISQNKISLSPYNDKRWISKDEDGNFSYMSFGHKDLRKSNE